ncbi:MAG: flavodoxin family protein [Desulfovibrionaceae bacterium]|nr:flavodoxin family protein [Desulfovibrionaceae bacterium]
MSENMNTQPEGGDRRSRAMGRRQFLERGAAAAGALALAGLAPRAAYAAEQGAGAGGQETVVKEVQAGQTEAAKAGEGAGAASAGGETKAMKVLGICGSARKQGNTSLLIGEVFRELEKAGIGTELVELAGSEILPCRACFACAKTGVCVVKRDAFVPLFDKMKAADGIVLGSPVYSADVSARMKAFLERAAVVSDMRPGVLKHKVGASVVAARRGGCMSAVDTMNHFFLNHEVHVVGSTYWNMAYGRLPGEVLKDEEGMANMRNIGENMAHLLKCLHA